MDKPPIKMLVSKAYIQFLPDLVCGLTKPLVLYRSNLTFTHEINEINDGIDVVGCYGFLGILNIKGNDYLFYVSDAKPMKIFGQHTVYKIRSVQSIKVTDGQITDSTLVNQVCKYLSSRTYFSFKYDLTLPINLQNQQGTTDRSMRFWWNFNCLKKLFHRMLPPEWCLKVIQGYVGDSHTTLLGQQQLYISLISRREWIRGGTRYNHRGVDRGGSVANFVEQEQIISHRQYRYSYILIRGSVPIFWQQNGIRASTEITHSAEETQKAFQAHYDLLIKHYRNAQCFNLMQTQKPNESILSDHFKKYHKQVNSQYINYMQIDFHNVCKNYKFENLNPLILEFKKELKLFYFTKMEMDKIIYEQAGVARVNCLDCLDRTNVFMTKLCLLQLQYILLDIGVDMKQEFKSNSLMEIPDKFDKFEFLKIIKYQWGDSGDAISKLYAGTNATTTKMSKDGSNGWTGMFEHSLKGIQRFYKQNFSDKEKQDVYNIIRGKTQPEQTEVVGIVDQLEQQIKLEKQKQKNINILTISIDSQYESPQQIGQFFEQVNKPDIIIVCFQNINTLLIKQTFVKNLLMEALKPLGNYDIISQIQNVFIFKQQNNQFTFIYGKAKNLNFVEKILGKPFSKFQTEGLISEIYYHDYQIVIMNSLIDIGQLQNVVQYIEEINPDYAISIICTIQNSKINYDGTFEQYKQKYPTDTCARLYQLDQLCYIMQKNKTLHKNYQEGVISFKPDENLQWNSRIIYGSTTGIDAIQSQNYDEMKISKQKVIRLMIQIDYNSFSNAQKRKSIEQGDGEEAMFSSVYYQKQQIDSDDFELIQ